MKESLQKLSNRFESWNGFVKLPILLIVVIVCLFLAVNGSAISLSVGEEKLQVYFFDVGQASSALVVVPNTSAILIDTGSSDTASELVESVKTVLSKNGIDDLSFLILSHSDADHVGGTVKILDTFNPSVIFRPLIASLDESELVQETGCLMSATLTYQTAISAVWDENCEVVYHTDMELKLGNDVIMKMYAPQEVYYSETNSYSPYITIEYANVTFLFTGDATQTREKEFLQMLEDESITIKVDVLEVPHHGSKYSSSTEFLEAISPKYAVVSAGDSTHPSSEVLERLEAVGVEDVFVTKTLGTIYAGVSENGEIVFDSYHSSFDIPLIVVCLVCLMFMVFKIIDDKEKQKREKLYVFRRNLQ